MMLTVLLMVLVTVAFAAAVLGELAYRRQEPFRSRGEEFGRIVDEDLAARRERLKARIVR